MSLQSEHEQYDFRKHVEEQRKRDAERVHDRYDSVQDLTNVEAVTNGREGIKALMLINGGAAVAMLGFVGALAAKGSSVLTQMVPVANSLMWFAVGMAVAVVAFGLSYCANFCYAQAVSKYQRTYDHPFIVASDDSKWWQRNGAFFHWGALAASVAGLICFLVGIWSVRGAIVGLA
jgi:hypothetical protein